MREATEAQQRLLHAIGGDPYGVRTIPGAEEAYLRGDFDIAEFERRVDLLLRYQDGQVDIAILLPGERVMSHDLNRSSES